MSMPSNGQHSFLLYPLKNPYAIRLRGPLFCRLFAEYSEKGVFSGIYLYVHSLFIFGAVLGAAPQCFHALNSIISCC